MRLGIALGAALLAAACGGRRGPAPARVPRPAGPSATAADTGSWRGQAVTRTEELFAGRFPGVQVFPGAAGGIEVRIRGATSINGSSEPLFVVDGYPLPPGTGGLVAINPADVARIEVLKSAGEIAEYEVRGGNGVVRITTKRGR